MSPLRRLRGCFDCPLPTLLYASVTLLYLAFLSSAQLPSSTIQQQRLLNANAQSPSALPPRPSHHAPLLKVPSLNGYLDEEAESGTPIRTAEEVNSGGMQILVDDKDLVPGMPAAIYQYILTGYGAEKFAVDQRGYLYLNGGEVGKRPTYLLHVMAREVDTEPMRSSEPITLTIHVLYRNKPPRFAQPAYNASVSAYSSEPERLVMTLRASDPDSGEHGRLRYRIVGVSDGAGASFKYREVTNQLVAIGTLVPNRLYQVRLEAEDGGGLKAEALINIHATSPYTTSAAQQLHMMTSTPVPFPILSSAPPSPTYWHHQPQTIPTTVPLVPYPIATPVLTTSNSGPPSSTAVQQGSEVETDESGEKWETVKTRVSENAPPGTIVDELGVTIGPGIPLTSFHHFVNLQDSNSRGRIYFVIIDGNTDGAFTIDPDRYSRPRQQDVMGFKIERFSGIVSVAQGAQLNIAQRPIYFLTIEARLKGSNNYVYSTILEVSVEGENHPPEFIGPTPITMRFQLNDAVLKSGTALLPDMSLGRVGVRDVDEGENGRLHLSIMAPMDRNQGDLAIRGHFTSSHMGEHSLVVMARDGGQPPMQATAAVIVSIEGSLPKPTGSSFSSSASTGSFSSSSSTDYSDPRSVDESGRSSFSSLFSRATLPPEYTPAAPFTQFSMSTPAAPPSPSSSEVEEVVEAQGTAPLPAPAGGLKRVAPIFAVPNMLLKVDEEEQNFELCNVSAYYPDKAPGSVTYQLQLGDLSLFQVDPKSGQVTLIEKLDAEGGQRSYMLRIGTLEAADSANYRLDPSQGSHTATIHVQAVDVNDWIPNFEQDLYTFEVDASSGKGSIVGEVIAYDNDTSHPNNKLAYTLSNNTDSTVQEYFEIDAQRGVIKAKRELDALSGKKITINVQADDGGEPQQSAWTVVSVRVSGKKKVENEPDVRAKTTLAPSAVGEKEDTSRSDGVAETVAPSPKSKAGEEPQMQFSSKNYSLSVEVMESVQPPILVKTLEILYKPIGHQFIQCRIASGNFRGVFSVSLSLEGNCELRTQSQLDREVVDRYLLNVTASHGSYMISAPVAVTVLDQNDNAPKFTFSSRRSHVEVAGGGYFTGLSSQAAANTKVLSVQALDPDVGNNSAIEYVFDKDSYDNKYFDIDKRSGDITLRKRAAEISRESRKSEFDFRVKACDSPSAEKGPQLCTKAQVYVDLIDNQHRFVTVLRGATPQLIWEKEAEFSRVLRKFTGLCSLLLIERVDEKTSNGAVDGGGYSPTTVNVFWYGVRGHQSYHCDLPPLKWFTMQELRDTIEDGDRLDADEDEFGFMAAIDWRNPSGFLILASVGVAVIAVLSLCAICLCRTRSRKSKLKAAIGPKRGITPYHTHHMPRYNPSNISPPSLIHHPTSGNITNPLKLYETQMREAPVMPDDRSVTGRPNQQRLPSISAINPVAFDNEAYLAMTPRTSISTFLENNGYTGQPSYVPETYFRPEMVAGNGSGVPNCVGRGGYGRSLPQGAMGNGGSMMFRHNTDEGDFSIDETSNYSPSPTRRRPEMRY